MWAAAAVLWLILMSTAMLVIWLLRLSWWQGSLLSLAIGVGVVLLAARLLGVEKEVQRRDHGDGDQDQAGNVIH